jgi:hypothetical protein
VLASSWRDTDFPFCVGRCQIPVTAVRLVARLLTTALPLASNYSVKPLEPDDVISADPRAVSGPAVLVTAVAVLAAALAGAIIVAVHYRAEASALRRRPVRSIIAAPASRSGPLRLASGTAALPPSEVLNGELTVFTARSSGTQAQIVLSGQITGGRPHTRYAVIGFDCDGSSVGYETWAVGVTGADGRATLNGRSVTVSLSDYYWVYLRLPSQRPGSSLLGSFTAAGKFSASPAGNPACQ